MGRGRIHKIWYAHVGSRISIELGLLGGNEDDDELSAYEVSADLKIFLLASIIITTKRREVATCLPFAIQVGQSDKGLIGSWESRRKPVKVVEGILKIQKY